MKVIIDIKEIDYGQAVEKLLEVGADNVGNDNILNKVLSTIMHSGKGIAHFVTNMIPKSVVNHLIKALINNNKTKIMTEIEKLSQEQGIKVILDDVHVE